MFIFVSEKGRALVTKTDLVTFSSFSLPELDKEISALVTQTQVTPRPAIQIQGTLGGRNYLNVFGEDPLQIQINGILVGTQCGVANQVASSLGMSVEFFAKNGVVNRTTPLRYTITGQPSREAFLVAMNVGQESAFADMSRFNMTLLAESLQKFSPPRPRRQVRQVQAAQAANPVVSPSNTGLIGSANPNFVVSRVLSVPSSSLLPSGGVSSPQLSDVAVAGYLKDSDGVTSLDV